MSPRRRGANHETQESPPGSPTRHDSPPRRAAIQAADSIAQLYPTRSPRQGTSSKRNPESPEPRPQKVLRFADLETTTRLGTPPQLGAPGSSRIHGTAQLEYFEEDFEDQWTRNHRQPRAEEHDLSVSLSPEESPRRAAPLFDPNASLVGRASPIQSPSRSSRLGAPRPQSPRLQSTRLQPPTSWSPISHTTETPERALLSPVRHRAQRSPQRREASPANVTGEISFATENLSIANPPIASPVRPGRSLPVIAESPIASPVRPGPGLPESPITSPVRRGTGLPTNSGSPIREYSSPFRLPRSPRSPRSPGRLATDDRTLGGFVRRLGIELTVGKAALSLPPLEDFTPPDDLSIAGKVMFGVYKKHAALIRERNEKLRNEFNRLQSRPLPPGFKESSLPRSIIQELFDIHNDQSEIETLKIEGPLRHDLRELYTAEINRLFQERFESSTVRKEYVRLKAQHDALQKELASLENAKATIERGTRATEELRQAYATKKRLLEAAERELDQITAQNDASLSLLAPSSTPQPVSRVRALEHSSQNAVDVLHQLQWELQRLGLQRFSIDNGVASICAHFLCLKIDLKTGNQITFEQTFEHPVLDYAHGLLTPLKSVAANMELWNFAVSVQAVLQQFQIVAQAYEYVQERKGLKFLVQLETGLIAILMQGKDLLMERQGKEAKTSLEELAGLLV